MDDDDMNDVIIFLSSGGNPPNSKRREDKPPDAIQPLKKRKYYTVEYMRKYYEKKGIDYIKFDEPSRTFIVKKSIDSLDDLISLGKLYHEEFKYNIEMEKIHSITNPLIELQKMIGFESIKSSVLSQLLYFLTDVPMGEPGMDHVVISGPPGCGKTTFAQILGRLYKGLGKLTNDKFVIAKRTDMIAQYLGQTAHCTKKVVESAKGGVLLIDEVTSLGDTTSEINIYTRECLDTLNQCLSELKDSILVIICGYANEIENSIFRVNAGLKRRFPNSYKIEPYTPTELSKIFEYIANKNHWEVENGAADPELFKDKDLFHSNGGSCETLFDKARIVHVKKKFCEMKTESVHTFDKEDINEAIGLMKKECYKPVKDIPPPGMYT